MPDQAAITQGRLRMLEETLEQCIIITPRYMSEYLILPSQILKEVQKILLIISSKLVDSE